MMDEIEMQQHSLSREEWDETARKLREPFDPNDVDFRLQGKISEQTGKGQVVAYIDARVVQDRLDSVVGAGNWSFDWTPLVIDKGEVLVTKGTLTVFGVSKSDAGSASNFEQSLGAVSHCFKRAAVHWGIGRYLYNLPMSWVPMEKGGRISEQVVRELRSRLPRPKISSVVEQQGEGERVVDAPVERRAAAPTRSRPATTIRETSAAHEAPAAEATAPVRGRDTSSEMPATEQQLTSIRKLCTALGKAEPEPGLTYPQARELLTQLSGEYQKVRRAS